MILPYAILFPFPVTFCNSFLYNTYKFYVLHVFYVIIHKMCIYLIKMLLFINILLMAIYYLTH